MATFHKNTAEAVVQSLKQVFQEGKYADNVVEKVLKSNSRWGSRDRRFIAESIYQMVRWWRLLLYLTNQEDDTSPDFWQLLACYFIISNKELPTWAEFENLNHSEINNRIISAKDIRKVRESIPDWIDELGEAELNQNWDKELHALNQPAQVVLRVNTLKISLAELKSELEAGGINTVAIKQYPEALLLEKRQNLIQSPLYKDGFFEIQDASSQLVAHFLRLEPGMNVIDACAGAGGKSLHMAAVMKNKGRLTVMDIDSEKLNELSMRAKRAGISILNIKPVENIEALSQSADRLLLDVPCSGLGVLKRNPDAKWKLTPQFIAEVKKTQLSLLQNYSQMLKKGGIMVYATCSILPSENEKQVSEFLSLQKGSFELIEDKRCMPSSGFDGFYMAAIKRI